MWDEKIKGDDEAPLNIIKCLAKNGLEVMKFFLKNVHENAEWSKDFTGFRGEAKSYEIQRPSHRTANKDSSEI